MKINIETKFNIGDNVFVYDRNEIKEAKILDILIDNGGWCYEYVIGRGCYSGGKEVFATKEEVIDFYGL